MRINLALLSLALIMGGSLSAHAQDERDTYVKMYAEDGKLVPRTRPQGIVPAHQSVRNSSDVAPTAVAPTAAQTTVAAAPASSTPIPTRANTVSPPPGRRAAPLSSSIGSNGESLIKVESFGTLTDAKTGGLGTDMWDGSNRAGVSALIQSLPDAPEIRTANSLTRRALLTAADTSLLNGDATPAPGDDLLTLRIRKLMTMGAVDDAAALYKENPLPPHDAAMAVAGIEALLADAQPSLACLETKALDNRFSGAGDSDWQKLNSFCTSLLGRYSGRADTASRLHAGSLHDLDRQPVLDRLFLTADHRVDYGTAGSDVSGLSPLTLALVVHDKSAPVTVRFNLLIAGAHTGIFDESDIADFYKDMPFGNLAQTDAQVSSIKIGGWQRVAWLYKSSYAQHGLIDKSILQAALPLRAAYGDIALWPFASILQTTDAAGFSGDTVRSAVIIALQAGETIPDSWNAAWKATGFGRTGDAQLRFAYNFSGVKGAVLPSDANGLSKQSTELLTIAANELDKGKKLHNINDADAYGNAAPSAADSDLTDLSAAENDHRLGETVLLTSSALGDKSSASLSPSLFRSILRAYRLIGLNKEARALAIEVALGLK